MLGENRRAHWSRLVAEYKASNLSVAAFCRKHRMEGGRLYYWVKKLGGVETPSRAVSRFVRVAASYVEPADRDTPVSVRLPGGIEIRSMRYPEPDWLASMLRCLHGGQAQ